MTEEEIIKAFHSTFPERLIWLLWTNNLNASKLAEEWNLFSSTGITYWCQGQRHPRQENLEVLSQYFEVDFHWLEPKSNESTIDYEDAKQIGLSRPEFFIWKMQNR